jgi:hypothetical protein
MYILVSPPPIQQQLDWPPAQQQSFASMHCLACGDEDEDLAGLLILLVKVQTFILTLSFD